MPIFFTIPKRPPKPLLPAWLVSILLHVATIALLCVAIRPMSRGAAEAQLGSIGLVLHNAGAEGALSDGDPYAVRQTLAVAELSPPLLLAANETNDSASETKENAERARSTESTGGTAPAAAKSAIKPNRNTKTNSRPNSSSVRLGSSGGNGYAQVSLFGVQGKGNKFIYVFDRSASMEGLPLAAAKKQLLDSLQSLDSIQQFHIIFFNTKTQSLDISGGGRRIAFASDRNKKLAANFVGGITADGGTDRMFALREAISYSPDVIFFLTDADDPMKPSEMAELARANRKAQAAICVIEFGKKPAPVPNNFLARLAHDTGGQYGYVNTTKLH